MRAPKYFFKEVLDWGQEAHNGGFDWNYVHPDRNLFAAQLQKRFKLPPPTSVQVQQEYAEGSPILQRSVEVVVWDVLSQIHRIFTNRKLMHRSNLNLGKGGDPCGWYVPSKRAHEFQDGTMHQDAQRKFRKNPDDVVICPVGYTDGTHCTENGRHTMNPVVVTFSIFTLEARRDPETWIVLGYVTEPRLSIAESKTLNAQLKSRLPGICCRNFHRQLRCVFDGLRKIQYGVRMHICLGLTWKTCNVILPLLCFLGDGKSQDMVAGRVFDYNPLTASRLCWACDCPADKSHSPEWASCNWITQKDVEPVIRQALGHTDVDAATQRDAQEELRSFSMYPVENAFFDLLIASAEGGVYYITPMDVMHAVDEGVTPYLQLVFQNLFGDKGRTLIDRLLRLIAKTKRQSAWSRYPRCNFTFGVTNLSKIKACERLGVIFLFAILCRVGLGRMCFTDLLEKKRNKLHEAAINSTNETAYFTQYDDTSRSCIDNYGRLMETVCIFREWTKREDGFWDVNDATVSPVMEKLATESICGMVSLLIGTAPRVKVKPVSKEKNKKDGVGTFDDEFIEGDSEPEMEYTNEAPREDSDDSLHSNDDCATIDETRREDCGSNLCDDDEDLETGTRLSTESLHSKTSKQAQNRKVLSISGPTLRRRKTAKREQECRMVSRTRKTLRLWGRGWNLQKLHLLFHLPRHIVHFGSIRNYCTAASETHHKLFAKYPASQAQKRHKVFLRQCAMVTHAHQLAEIGCAKYEVDEEEFINDKINASDFAAGPNATRFMVTLKRSGEARQTWHTRSESVKCRLPRPVVNFLQHQMSHEFANTMECVTEMVIPDVGVVRSHPDFQAEGPWLDWVMVRRTERRLVETSPHVSCRQRSMASLLTLMARNLPFLMQ